MNKLLAVLSLLVACSGSATGETKDSSSGDKPQGQASPSEPPKPAGLPAPEDVAAPPANAEKSESGLAWRVLTPGTGDQKPAAEDTVEVHYTGWTTDGRMFDSSVTRGKPAKFPLNRV